MKRVRRKTTAYLSGGMQYAVGNGADWRVEIAQWLRQELSHASIDPVRRSRSLMRSMKRQGARLYGNIRAGGDWNSFFRRIVDSDTRFVARNSDYVICLWNQSARRGAGTQGELTVARQHRVPVYLVSRTPLERLPGWVQGCTTRHFGSWNALREYLKKVYSRQSFKRS